MAITGSGDFPILDTNSELYRTKPDYVVYVPESQNGSTYDNGNEHFLVFDGPDGSLMAVWTQSTFESAGDHRLVFSKSNNEGLTWEQPMHIAGPRHGIKNEMIASWGFPIISQSGRIYIVYNQHIGIVDCVREFTGLMACVYSDDMGKTWSEQGMIPMKRSPYDHPDERIPPNWIVWQTPIRDLNGKWFVGFTRWFSEERRIPPHQGEWSWECVVEFMRFDNIDENPESADLKVSFSAFGENALRVPHYTNPRITVAQEPSIVRLPDNRLFCVMRTMTGYIWYSVSSDDGLTWRSPSPLLRRDHGKVILEPICCCPIYEFDKGKYILLHHNNDGRFEGCQPDDSLLNRRPAFIALGEYKPNAEQPIWFRESKQFMDTDGVKIGPLQRNEIGVYSSFTSRKGNRVLWHPDRKFFLVGKRITEEWLSSGTA